MTTHIALDLFITLLAITGAIVWIILAWGLSFLIIRRISEWLVDRILAAKIKRSAQIRESLEPGDTEWEPRSAAVSPATEKSGASK